MAKKLYKLPDQGQLTGVAAGLAEYCNLDPTVMRLIIVFLAFLTNGLAVLVYFLLAIVLPVKGDRGDAAQSAEPQTVSVDSEQTISTTRNWFGGALIVIGGWYLINQLWPGLVSINWGLLWPIALIALGVFILIGRR